MRNAVLLLLLSLLTPSIPGIVCDVQCAHAERYGAVAASPAGCHEQESSSSGPTLTAADDGVCHNEVAAVLATVPERLISQTGPATVQLPSALSTDRPLRSLVIDFDLDAFNRPDIVLITTQLRI